MGAAARSALLRTLRRQICALSCGYALKQGSMFDRVVKVSVRNEVGEPACAVWVQELTHTSGGHQTVGGAVVILVSAPEIVEDVNMASYESVRVMLARDHTASGYRIRGGVDG